VALWVERALLRALASLTRRNARGSARSTMLYATFNYTRLAPKTRKKSDGHRAKWQELDWLTLLNGKTAKDIKKWNTRRP
jgi:hypothetical protein